MPRLYDHRSNAWLGLAAVAGVLLAALLVWMAWTGSEQAHGFKLSLSDAAPTLPPAPELPQGPTLPDAPIPIPKQSRAPDDRTSQPHEAYGPPPAATQK